MPARVRFNMDEFDTVDMPNIMDEDVQTVETTIESPNDMNGVVMTVVTFFYLCQKNLLPALLGLVTSLVMVVYAFNVDLDLGFLSLLAPPLVMGFLLVANMWLFVVAAMAQSLMATYTDYGWWSLLLLVAGLRRFFELSDEHHAWQFLECALLGWSILRPALYGRLAMHGERTEQSSSPSWLSLLFQFAAGLDWTVPLTCVYKPFRPIVRYLSHPMVFYVKTVVLAMESPVGKIRWFFWGRQIERRAQMEALRIKRKEMLENRRAAARRELERRARAQQEYDDEIDSTEQSSGSATPEQPG